MIIELGQLGKKEIQERLACDVLDTATFATFHEGDLKLSLFINARVLEDSLKRSKKWYERKLTAKRLMKLLTPKELYEGAQEVINLESKKKVVPAENQ